jgi:hypothetical protein
MNTQGYRILTTKLVCVRIEGTENTLVVRGNFISARKQKCVKPNCCVVVALCEIKISDSLVVNV